MVSPQSFLLKMKHNFQAQFGGVYGEMWDFNPVGEKDKWIDICGIK